MSASDQAGDGEFRIPFPVDPRPRVDVGDPFRRLNGGWLALDFVNTVPGWLERAEGDGVRRRDWGDRPAGERLRRYADLVLWARLEGLVTEGQAENLEREAEARPAEASVVIERARSLRGSLYRLFKAALEAWDPPAEDLALVDTELDRLRRGERLAWDGERFAIEWAAGSPELDALLWPPARSAVDLLTSPELVGRLGQCGGAGCGWLFVDVGRGRPRRWCDIRDCGNVAKVQAYRRRERRSGAG